MRQQSTLGQLLKAERQRRGWTLREMSEQVGIPLSTLAKVEQDKLSLTYDKLQQMTTRLGVTLADFLAQESAESGTHAAITARRSTIPGNDNTARPARSFAGRSCRYTIRLRRRIGHVERPVLETTCCRPWLDYVSPCAVDCWCVPASRCRVPRQGRRPLRRRPRRRRKRSGAT